MEEYWIDATIPFLAALAWPILSGHRVRMFCFVLAAVLYLYVRCTRVLWESVIVLPSLGIQFETHRGTPSAPLFASRRFIPLSSLQDFVINEGLRRWDIRYYLVAIQRPHSNMVSLVVAYEVRVAIKSDFWCAQDICQNTLPRFPVLREVYHGVHETLLKNLT
ncbi:hypothetical protein AcW1_005802 [Taiwanofungus camphoratus]|nr:hypothetical protein AcW2_004562 [Antrodia cinnamomea]KAI0934201.1 hypothetical protein AcV5_006126 [Antrodia cinnamomea]KAI0957397.1 hypothetical protein AcW1_005802 [Antrodia cinnamomea]